MIYYWMIMTDTHRTQSGLQSVWFVCFFLLVFLVVVFSVCFIFVHCTYIDE